MDARTPDNTTTAKRLDALLVLMERLADLHHQLHTALGEKLGAMGRADLSRVQTCTDREQSLVARIQEQEGLRRQLMEQVGRGFGLSPQAARSLPARNLSRRLTAPYRRKFDEVTERLRHTVHRVRRANDLVSRVSARTLQHVREVFAAVSGAPSQGGAYAQRGATTAAQTSGWGLFEAIG